jgi:hypothetical protein
MSADTWYSIDVADKSTRDMVQATNTTSAAAREVSGAHAPT